MIGPCDSCYVEVFMETGTVTSYDGDTLILDFGGPTLWLEREVSELPCYCTLP